MFTIDPGNPFTTATGLIAYAIIADQTDYIPTADAATNRTSSDVTGNKADAAVQTVAATKSLVAYAKGLVTGQATQLFYKDQWCDPSGSIASLAFSNAAADKSFPDVVLPAAGTFLPPGAVIQSVYLLLKWRKMVDTSAALNAINAANKTIRIKKAADAWGASTIAMTMLNGAWSVAASAVEGGDMIIGSVDIKAKVNAQGTTYNVRSEQTTNADAITVTGASLTLWDVYAGLRVAFTLV